MAVGEDVMSAPLSVLALQELAIWTTWACGLTIPWRSQTVSKHGPTPSLYVPAIQSGGWTDSIFGLAVYFLCSGDLTARRCNQTIGS
jgi:hypothetical protein